MSEEKKLKYQVVLEEFLELREWSDELTVDPENGTTMLDTGITVGGQSGRLIIEARDETDVVDAFIYYQFKGKASKTEQIVLLFNGIHLRFPFGRFEMTPEGSIRWRDRVDFEGSQPSGLSIERLISPGWRVTADFAESIAAVSLTKMTAEEALDEFDAAQEAASEDEGEGEDEGEAPTAL